MTFLVKCMSTFGSQNVLPRGSSLARVFESGMRRHLDYLPNPAVTLKHRFPMEDDRMMLVRSAKVAVSPQKQH